MGVINANWLPVVSIAYALLARVWKRFLVGAAHSRKAEHNAFRHITRTVSKILHARIVEFIGGISLQSDGFH